MKNKTNELYKRLGIDTSEFESIEVEETQTVYRIVKCKEHDGRAVGCAPCLQQLRGLRQRKVVHVA